jgi:hypothetical protein
MNFGNGSGSGERICGELGSIELANRRGPTYSSAGAVRPSSLSKQDTLIPAVDTPDHFLNWLQCLRSRQAPNAPIEAGYDHCVPALMAMRWLDTGRRQVYRAQTREIREG